jgi:hypothetical protein
MRRVIDWLMGIPKRPKLHPVERLLRRPENSHRAVMAIIHTAPGETAEIPVDTEDGPRVIRATVLHRVGGWLIKKL